MPVISGTTHSTTNVFGKKLTVVYFDEQKYLIGVQIAALLKRETFNMYRSMKIKNVRIKRAAPEQVEYLCQCNAVRPGTHSVTLIPFETGLYFIADAWTRQHKIDTSQKIRSFVADKPKLHRRKPHPWNVHRSLKKDALKSELDPFPTVHFSSPSPSPSPVSSPPVSPTLADLQIACSLSDCEDNLQCNLLLNTNSFPTSPDQGDAAISQMQSMLRLPRLLSVV